MEHTTVIGAGPLGRAATRSPVEAGHRIMTVTRSGTQLPGAQAARADIVTGDSLEALALGAPIVACCGTTCTITRWYRDWPLAIDNLIKTAERQDATLTATGNYYSYVRGRMPMRATDSLDHPPPALGEVRVEVSHRLLAAREQRCIRAVEVWGSPCLKADAGPGAYLGPRFVDSLLAKGATNVLGDPDLSHAMTAIPNFGRLLARVVTNLEVPGRARRIPNAPTVSIRELARILLRAVGRGNEPRLCSMPASLLRVLGWSSPTLGAVRETLRRNTEPSVADDTDARGLLGKARTPLEETAAGIITARDGKVA